MLLLLTALSWLLLACICGVQYLSGQAQVMSVKCQSAVLLQPQAVVGGGAAAAAAQAASPSAQEQQHAEAPAPAQQQLERGSGEQQQVAGEQQQQSLAGGADGNGTRSNRGHGSNETSSSSGGSSSSSEAGASAVHLPESWRDVDALIQAPTPRHGLQKKGGLPNRWVLPFICAGFAGCC